MRNFLQTYNDIALRTNDPDHRLELRDITTDSEYYCTLAVTSDGFSAVRRFEFADYNVNDFLAELAEMEKTLKGRATFKNFQNESHFALKMQITGRLLVSGILSVEREYPQRLEFCFETDQTVLKPLIADFKNYLRYG